jgi:hypothetical protein
MIERLARIWPEVNPVTRGMLHYRSLRAEAQAAAAAASGASASPAVRSQPGSGGANPAHAA